MVDDTRLEILILHYHTLSASAKYYDFSLIFVSLGYQIVSTFSSPLSVARGKNRGKQFCLQSAALGLSPRVFLFVQLFLFLVLTVIVWFSGALFLILFPSRDIEIMQFIRPYRRRELISSLLRKTSLSSSNNDSNKSDFMNSSKERPRSSRKTLVNSINLSNSSLVSKPTNFGP